MDLGYLPFFKTKRVLAIDVSEAVLKFVEVDFTGEKPQITNFDIVPLPPSLKDIKDKQEYQEIIESVFKDILEKNSIQAKELVLLISGGSVFSRKIRIPKLPPKELESGIKWEASNQIPFSLENSYFDWQLLGEITLPDGTKNDEYMIAASSKRTVDDMVSLAFDAGLRPICIGIPIFAIYNLIYNSSQFNTNEKIAVVDIGARRTNIVIIQEKRILFAREIHIGDDSFNEAIANEFIAEKWDFDRVTEIKKEKKIFKKCLHDDTVGRENNSDDAPTKRIISVIRPLLERLFNEIKRSFDYFKEQFDGARIEKIVLCGKGALEEGFDDIFSKIFSVPVEFLNISDVFVAQSNLDVEKLNKEIFDLAIVLGLALGRDRQINFVPREFKERKHQLSQLVISLGIFLFLMMVSGILIIHANILSGTLRSQIKSGNKQMTSVLPQVAAFNKKCLLYKSDKKFMDNLRMRQLLLANALKELSNIVPRAISFKQIQLMEDNWLRIDGFVFDDTVAGLSSESVLTDFIIAIENSPFFIQVKLVSSERGSVFEVPHSVFNISCKIISRKEIKDI